MASTSPASPTKKPASAIWRGVQILSWMLLVPLIAIVAVGSYAYWQVDNYFAAHEQRVYTGVSAMDVDLSRLTRSEATTQLQERAALLDANGVTFVDPQLDTQFAFRWSELGVTLDVDKMVTEAFDFGRNQPNSEQLIFDAWYRGEQYPPIWVVDEIKLNQTIDALAAQLATPSQDANFALEDNTVSYTSSASGRTLDTAPLVDYVLAHVGQQAVEPLTMGFDAIAPEIASMEQQASAFAELLDGDRTLYVEQPVDSADLEQITIPSTQVEAWLGFDAAQNPTVDQAAIYDWLAPQAARFSRTSADARFYFDDFTEELVPVEPHVNGRELDVETSTQRIVDALRNGYSSIPLAFIEIVPKINSNVTGAELGITELLAEETTWFFDSPDNRKHNIRIGASKFYGIVIKPGEEFSFNNYLGPISYETDFVDGLVIIGGRTQGGIGGGICQVSTTMFQAAFWAGLDIVERNQHGYRVSYYENAPRGIDKPHGMDAAIYSSPNDPSLNVDFKFTNNTPHHILVESYYYEEDESLTVKFYSTSMGRVVERSITTAEEANPPEDRYVYNAELEAGEIKQVEWAAEGGIASVYRIVYNKFGGVRDEEYFVSRYTPWANVYEYGDGADIP